MTTCYRSVATFSFFMFTTAVCHAHELEKYQYKVDTGTLSQLLHGPNALGFFTKHMAIMVKTEGSFTLDNASSAPVRGMLFGQYRSPKGTVDLELHVEIKNRQLETDYSPPQIDAIVYDWEEMYATPAALKGLQPQLKRLTFRDGQGLLYDCMLKRHFDYLLTLQIGYDNEQKKLQNLLPQLVEVKKFVESIEGDTRGQTILQSNKSGLPAFVIFEDDKDGRFIRLHHPMHDIRLNRDTHVYDYAYSDDVAQVSKLPEVKRLLADETIRTFVFGKAESIHVAVKGNPKAGFDGVFTRMNSGERLAARLEGKKVIVSKR